MGRKSWQQALGAMFLLVHAQCSKNRCEAPSLAAGTNDLGFAQMNNPSAGESVILQEVEPLKTRCACALQAS